MKCPFCGKEMLCGGTICLFDPDCPIYHKPVPTEVLELLYRTRKALDVAVKGLKHMRGTCLSYAADYMDAADNILEQITALEQKEAK